MGKRKTGKKVIDLSRERRIRENLQNIKDIYADDGDGLKRLTDKLKAHSPVDNRRPHDKCVSESPNIKGNGPSGRGPGQPPG